MFCKLACFLVNKAVQATGYEMTVYTDKKI